MKLRNKNTKVEETITDKENEEIKEVKLSLIGNLMKTAMLAGDWDTVDALRDVEIEHNKDIRKEYNKGFKTGYWIAIAGSMAGVVLGNVISDKLIKK